MIALWLLAVVIAASETVKPQRPSSNEQTLLAGSSQECCVEETPWTHQDPESHGPDRQDALLAEFNATKIRKHKRKNEFRKFHERTLKVPRLTVCIN